MKKEQKELKQITLKQILLEDWIKWKISAKSEIKLFKRLLKEEAIYFSNKLDLLWMFRKKQLLKKVLKYKFKTN